MWQLVLAYISVQGWVIDPYVNGVFDGSCNVLVLSAHNAKIVNRYVMTSSIVIAMVDEGTFMCSFRVFCKCSA